MRVARYADLMVPTLLLLGLIAGLALPWRTGVWVAIAVILLTAMAWPVLLIAAGVDSGVRFALGAAAIGAGNTAVGAIVGVAVRVALGGARVALRAS